MKNGRLLSAFFTLSFLFAVVSCRDNNPTLQPNTKSNKGSGARAIGNSALEDWQNNLSWSQQNFINQQGDPENFAYDLWNDERSVSGVLTSRDMETDVVPEYPLNCYQIALLGAYHTASIGASKAQQWIIMTYIDGVGYSTETTFNFNVGKNIALSSTSDLGDRVFNEMFGNINSKNFKVPGTANNFQQIGTINGVPIYRDPLVDVFADPWAASTFPFTSRSNSEIHLGTSAADAAANNTRRVQLIQHEFGHILQKEYVATSTGSQISALTCYYGKIAPRSAKSVRRQNTEPNYYHKCFWTEVTANSLSKNSFYPNNAPGWNESDYPTNNNSQCSGYEVRAVSNMCL